MSRAAGQSRPSTITVTYLEIGDPTEIHPPSAPAPEGLAVRVISDPAVNRDMYERVGEPYRWTDRLAWSEVQWRTWADRVETWVVELDGARAGYYEIETEPEAAKIAIFGLLDEFHGRGAGGHALTLALRRAFEIGPRVWLTTCSLDGPAALPNYLARGLEISRIEERPWSG